MPLKIAMYLPEELDPIGRAGAIGRGRAYHGSQSVRGWSSGLETKLTRTGTKKDYTTSTPRGIENTACLPIGTETFEEGMRDTVDLGPRTFP